MQSHSEGDGGPQRKNDQERSAASAKLVPMLSNEQALRIVAKLAKGRLAHVRLSELAERTSWSKFYLQRKIQAFAGESPTQYQQRLNLEEAAVRLQQTNDSVLDIALDAGYASHEVFTRAFARTLHCTPQEYRARFGSTSSQNSLHKQFVRHVGPCIGLYRTTTESKTRRACMPTSDVRRLDLPAQPIVFIQRRVKRTEFQALFAECFPKLYGHCMENGLAMAGQPIARYVEHTPGMATVDCIIPLASATEDHGEIKAGELQSGPTAVATHTGPYEQLEATYGVIESWLAENGLARNGPYWECYVTDPGDEPDPDKWETEVFFPIK